MQAEDIKCPKCERTIRPPFQACQQEHLVCPICKQHQDFETGLMENEAGVIHCEAKVFSMPLLNKLFTKSKGKCQYGCGFGANFLELEKHEQVCFRHDKLVKCLIPGCSWYSVLSKLARHVDEAHPAQLIDITSEQPKIVSLENQIYLLLQFGKEVSDNEIYWLRVYENGQERYIIMLHLGRSNPKDETDRTLCKYSVSSINNDELVVKSKIVLKNQEYEAITNEVEVMGKGTRITPLEGTKYVIKAKKPQKIPVETMVSMSCCVCTESMASNHKCEANCQTQKWNSNGDSRVGLVALKDISAGTELTFNYDITCTNQNNSSCTCGAPLCPGYKGIKRKRESEEETNRKLTRQSIATSTPGSSYAYESLSDISDILKPETKSKVDKRKNPNKADIAARVEAMKIARRKKLEDKMKIAEARRIGRQRYIEARKLKMLQKMMQQEKTEKDHLKITANNKVNTETSEENTNKSNERHTAEEKRKNKENKQHAKEGVKVYNLHENLKDVRVEVENLTVAPIVIPKLKQLKAMPSIPKIKLKKKKIVNINGPKRGPGRPRIHPIKIKKPRSILPTKIIYNITPSELLPQPVRPTSADNSVAVANETDNQQDLESPVKQESITETEAWESCGPSDDSAGLNPLHFNYVPQIKIEDDSE